MAGNPKLVGNHEARFWSKIDMIPESTCWHWSGLVGGDGYGKFSVGQRTVRAHRFSYELHYGKIPEGMVIAHRCDVPLCCRPEHLMACTQAENIQDCVNKKRQYEVKKTHCPRGHEYTGENLFINTHTGGRVCKICQRALANRLYHAKRARLGK